LRRRVKSAPGATLPDWPSACSPLPGRQTPAPVLRPNALYTRADSAAPPPQCATLSASAVRGALPTPCGCSRPCPSVGSRTFCIPCFVRRHRRYVIAARLCARAVHGGSRGLVPGVPRQRRVFAFRKVAARLRPRRQGRDGAGTEIRNKTINLFPKKIYICIFLENNIK
jgi:hypothetical protein